MSYPQFKTLPQSTDDIKISHYGPNCLYHTRVYLYADVLEELQFNAKERSAIGTLQGSYAIIRRDAGSPPSDAQDFIELKAFRDVYPTANALDYANYLRKLRDFKPDESATVLGPVFMQQQPAPPTLEDLLLMRSYFGSPIQIALYVCGDRTPAHVYILDDVNESFAEIGYFVFHLPDSEPFIS